MSIWLGAVSGNILLPSGTMTMLVAGIIIYMLAMLFIGWFSSRKVAGMSDFLVAGRRLPLWMATATLLATWFGAGSSMGVAATVYADGISGVIADPFGASLSLILAGMFIVGMLRKKGCMTVTDIIERRFGKAAGIYASLWMIPVYVGWLGAQLLGLGTILNLLTGISVIKGTLIGAAVVLLYTCAGGMWAVTLTDVVQVGIMILGLIVLLPGSVALAGGSEVLMENLSAADTLLPPKDAVFNDYTYYIGSWMIMGLGCMVGQDLVQRSLASKNAKVAVASSVISGFLYILIAFIPIVIGIAARIILPKYGITGDVMGENLENQVLPPDRNHGSGEKLSAVFDGFYCCFDGGDHEFGGQFPACRGITAVQQYNFAALSGDPRQVAFALYPDHDSVADCDRTGIGDLGQKYLQFDDKQLDFPVGSYFYSGIDGTLCSQSNEKLCMGDDDSRFRGVAGIYFYQQLRQRNEFC